MKNYRNSLLLTAIAVVLSLQPASEQRPRTDFRADLALSKEVFPPYPPIGVTATYTLMVENLGPTSTAKSTAKVVVTDHLPGCLEFVSATADRGTYDSEVWTIDAIKVGEKFTLKIVARVTNSCTGEVISKASISSSLEDPEDSNNQAEATFTPIHFCAKGEDPDRLCSFLPYDVAKDATPSAFDVFSWQSFVALNWPIDPSKRIGTAPHSQRVWETYMSPDDVFLPDGGLPKWQAHPRVPQACKDFVEDGIDTSKVVSMFSKASDIVASSNADLEAAVGKPLIDQKQNFIVVEVRLNKEEFDYIVKKGFYDAAAQNTFTGNEIEMPKGNNATKKVGAIEIKAAWRFLDMKQDSIILGRYFTQEALVYIRPQDTENGQPLCIDATLGLVGFHISHKTQTAPQWIWSTFEHVDNVRRGPGLPDGFSPTLTDLGCDDTSRCRPNQPTDSTRFLWQTGPAYALDFPPTQVLRVNPIPPSIRVMNKVWQDKLKEDHPESPWQYYELVGTQRPSKPRAFNPDALIFGHPQPTTLANTTMETYLQPTSSCMQCHGGRATLVDNDAFPDFSFLLGHACYSLGYIQPVLNRPCDALMLGQVALRDTDITKVVIPQGDSVFTRRVKIEQGAGSFELVCEVEDSDHVEGGGIDLLIEATRGIKFASGKSSETVKKAGRVRFPLQLGPGNTESMGWAEFKLHNKGAVAQVSCTLEPF